MRTGERLPPVALPDLSGAAVPLSRFSGRLCLILFLAGDTPDPSRLKALTAIEPELRSWGAETLLVAAASPPVVRELSERLGFTGLILVDAEGALHRRLGAAAPDGRPHPALLIIDRAGELRYRLDLPMSVAPPSSDALREAVGWARYLGVQEPECGCCSVAEGWAEQE